MAAFNISRPSNKALPDQKPLCGFRRVSLVSAERYTRNKNQTMKSNGHSETKCPVCLKSFNIHNNRTWKIEDPRLGMWFVDAMNQFEHFSEVTCPHCGNNFKAQEARLFGIFKSPYAVFFIATLLGLFIVAVVIGLVTNK